MSESEKIAVSMAELEELIDEAIAEAQGLESTSDGDGDGDEEPSINELLVRALEEDSPLDLEREALAELSPQLLGELAAEFGAIGATGNVRRDLEYYRDVSGLDEFEAGMLADVGRSDSPSANVDDDGGDDDGDDEYSDGVLR